jgi:hypothetical protein
MNFPINPIERPRPIEAQGELRITEDTNEKRITEDGLERACEFELLEKTPVNLT